MPPTTTFSRGDIVLVRFVFADERGAKRRPVLVLSTDAYHRGRQEVIVAALTSNVSRLLPGDLLLEYWRQASLPRPSVATAIVRTIKSAMIDHGLGRIDAKDLAAYEAGLRAVLGL